MPLPDTPDPKTSNLYQQLSSEQLGTASKTNFDIAQDSIFLDSTSEDELRRVNLIGQATNLQSQSGPIVGTMAVKTATIPGSGLFRTVHQPNQGEIWQVVAASFDLQNSTGNVKNRIYLSDGTNEVIAENESASADGEFIITTSGPLYYSYEVYLQAWSQGTFDDVVWEVAVVRVR